MIKFHILESRTSSIVNGLGANWVTHNFMMVEYTLQINDQNGCSKTFDFTLTEPPALEFTELGMEEAFVDYMVTNLVMVSYLLQLEVERLIITILGLI